MKLSAFTMFLFMSCAASQSQSEGPWQIVVTSSGGLAGRGAGDYTIASDGKITVKSMGGATCTYEATAAELARFQSLVAGAKPESWKPSYAPEDRCCDRFEYKLTLDRAGAEHATEWIDDPLPMPPDLQAMADAIFGGTESLRVVYGARCGSSR